MKRVDLFAIGILAFVAIVVEGVAAVQAPANDARALAAYTPIEMHRYLDVPNVQPKPKAHGVRSAARFRKAAGHPAHQKTKKWNRPRRGHT